MVSRGGKLGFEGQGRLGYVTGVIGRSRLQAFERVLFRATRGNIYLRSADITQQASSAQRLGQLPTRM